MSAPPSSPRSPGFPRKRALLYDPGGIYLRPLPPGRCCLPLFLTASASTHLFTGLNHTARTLAVYASPSGHPCGARLASGCAFGPGQAGLVTRGESFQGFSSFHPPWLKVTGAPGRREDRTTKRNEISSWRPSRSSRSSCSLRAPHPADSAVSEGPGRCWVVRGRRSCRADRARSRAARRSRRRSPRTPRPRWRT